MWARLHLRWKTIIEPAGAGGASGACFNCDATNWAEGGRWRRSRHLRRVQRPRQGDIEMISFPYRIRFKFPFLSDLFFLKIGMNSVKNRSKKWPAKSSTKTHADKQTDRIGPIRSSSGTLFWTAKTQIPLADRSKTCPQNDLKIQLTSQLKSTSGLPRSLHSPQVAPAAQLWDYL